MNESLDSTFMVLLRKRNWGGYVARREHQKSKILYILKILWEETDETHPISAVQMVQRLNSYGVVCERKTVYTDLEELAEFGFDIIRTRQGAYLGNRLFELPELKLLVDAVQSSKFITEKKSGELITKLGQLLNRYDSTKLKRQIFVKNRVKTMNESIYYNVDSIYEGIGRNCQIEFVYCKWNVKKELEPKRGGKKYMISPWYLRWEDEKYYLIGYEEQSGQMKHYRVDKMRQITLLERPRLGRKVYDQLDMSAYGKQIFGMFQGKWETVTLQADMELAGVFIDRFGQDVWMHPLNGGRFSVTVDVMVSNQFFGWLAGLNGVQIVEPIWVKEEYRKLLRALLEKED